MPRRNQYVLRPGEAVRLLNSTPAGEVASVRLLYRHRERAGLRIGDARTVDLLRYAAWLVDQYEQANRPAEPAVTGQTAYDRHRDAMARRSREGARAAAEIGEIPPVADPARRERCRLDLFAFLTTYFPNSTGKKPFSADHRRVIARLQQCALGGGRFVEAVYRGFGKALAIDTPIATPTGWKTMGALREGDRLFGSDGRPCRVVFATGVMSDRTCYRIVFDDGESVVCSGDHLWTVKDGYLRKTETLSTEVLASRCVPTGNRVHRYGVNNAAPVQYRQLGVPLPIDPYVLGVWLGNGEAASNRITISDLDADETIRNLTACGEDVLARPSTRKGRAQGYLVGSQNAFSLSLRTRLRSLGVLGNKHIPESYLVLGAADRLALLQGLMDTDGTVSKSGHCSFSSASTRLSDGVRRLLWSLGLKNTIKRHAVNGKDYWSVCFTAYLSMPCFRLERKRSRLREKKPVSICSSRRIVAVEQVESVPVKCIQVDARDGLYLCGRAMIPTHNTTISENTALWAALYGHRKFCPVLAGSLRESKEVIDSVKIELYENDLLHADFPEVCHAVRALENKPQRCASQTHQGRLTHVEWRADVVVLPTVAGSAASGAVIAAKPFKRARGIKHKSPDGTQLRPDFVIIDDPQDEESASSPQRVDKNLGILRKDVVKGTGHRRSLACVINATIIYPQDMIDRLLEDPSWQGERVPMVKAWANLHESAWLGEYARLRNGYDRSVVGDQERAQAAATAWYRQRRATCGKPLDAPRGCATCARSSRCLDAGAVISWLHCYDEAVEVSAVQHAYNALIDDGLEAFSSEYQNQPRPARTEGEEGIKADDVIKRCNGQPRGAAPKEAGRLTGFIDVGDRLLFWCVCAWADDFTGAIIDYGALPEQDVAMFEADRAKRTLAQMFPGRGREGVIFAGLERLVGELLGRDFPHIGGGLLRIEKLLVDMGHETATVAAVRQKVGGTTLELARGLGIGAGRRPMAEYLRKPGEVHGHHWYRPSVTRTMEFPHVVNDVNYWKSFVHARLATAPGDPGALTLFGRDPKTHRLFAQHVANSEYYVKTFGYGREVHEWKPRAGGPDNHWFDCLVGAAAAASMLGVGLPGQAAGPARRQRRRWTHEDFVLLRNGGRR